MDCSQTNSEKSILFGTESFAKNSNEMSMHSHKYSIYDDEPDENDEMADKTFHPSSEDIRKLYENLIAHEDYEKIQELFGFEAVEHAKMQAAERKRTSSRKPNKPLRKGKNKV